MERRRMIHQKYYVYGLELTPTNHDAAPNQCLPAWIRLEESPKQPHHSLGRPSKCLYASFEMMRLATQTYFCHSEGICFQEENQDYSNTQYQHALFAFQAAVGFAFFFTKSRVSICCNTRLSPSAKRQPVLLRQTTLQGLGQHLTNQIERIKWTNCQGCFARLSKLFNRIKLSFQWVLRVCIPWGQEMILLVQVSLTPKAKRADGHPWHFGITKHYPNGQTY